MTKKEYKTVLIVEDNANINAIYVKYFREKLNYKVYTEEDGRKAYETAMFFKPDIIICDLMIPSISGFDLIKKFRQIPELKDSVIIAVSALNRKEDVMTCIAGGADDYLVKPASFKVLEEKINSIIAKKTKVESEAAQKKTEEALTKAKEEEWKKAEAEAAPLN